MGDLIMKSVPRVDSLNQAVSLLGALQKIDEEAFIACSLAMYLGARYSEIRDLCYKDLKKETMHLGTQLHKGTGRLLPLANFLKLHLRPRIYDFKSRSGRVFTKSQIEINQSIKQACFMMGVKTLSFNSFRVFGCANLCVKAHSKEQAIYLTGFKPRYKNHVDLKKIFEFPSTAWEQKKKKSRIY